MSYTLTLLRHGQSVWNLENRFTGWKDVALTEQGIQEARQAGELLKAEGVGVDVVHTSLLLRAISTANLALEAMDRAWVPTSRNWRLNERHYGGLQGLDKKETAELHGEEQVFIWRRSFDIRPPDLELDDPRHPRHDGRYADLAPELLPRAECLADVVERVLPYWYDSIVPQLRAGKRVLVVAHGNSLRSLVKHLESIADDAIMDVNIPTGVPRVYTLDESLKPIRVQYLGNPEEVAKAAEAVANQAR